MKRKYPKIYYLHWILLVLWLLMLGFSLLISFEVIAWHSKVTVLQYVLCGVGLFSAAANIRFWRKQGREQ